MKCSVCGLPATILSGGALGCAVHGIRRLVDEFDIATWQRAIEITKQNPRIGLARGLKAALREEKP